MLPCAREVYGSNLGRCHLYRLRNSVPL